jgi:hypothetical protein
VVRVSAKERMEIDLIHRCYQRPSAKHEREAEGREGEREVGGGGGGGEEGQDNSLRVLWSGACRWLSTKSSISVRWMLQRCMYNGSEMLLVVGGGACLRPAAGRGGRGSGCRSAR